MRLTARYPLTHPVQIMPYPHRLIVKIVFQSVTLFTPTGPIQARLITIESSSVRIKYPSAAGSVYFSSNYMGRLE